MKRKIDGVLYLMRDKRPTRDLRELHRQFCEKFKTQISFHQWMIERGKVYTDIRERK